MAELSTLARPYAKAAFEYADAHKELTEWSTQLNLAAAVAQTGKMKEVLDTPSLTSEQQAEAFINVCGEALGEKLQNFVKLLAENKRLGLLPEINLLYQQFKANREKSVDVEVATVFELDADVTQSLSAKLASLLDREVAISTTIDKSLIGGVVVRAGDIMIDGSIRGRLDKLARSMNL